MILTALDELKFIDDDGDDDSLDDPTEAQWPNISNCIIWHHHKQQQHATTSTVLYLPTHVFAKLDY